MSSSQEWRFEIQTHHRDRKVTTSSATGNFLAHNFVFSGEFRVCRNDPEPMKRNLLAEIENLCCQDCQIFRETVIARLEARNEARRFFVLRRSKDHYLDGLCSWHWCSEALANHFWTYTNGFEKIILYLALRFFLSCPKVRKMDENPRKWSRTEYADFSIFGNRKITVLTTPIAFAAVNLGWEVILRCVSVIPKRLWKTDCRKKYFSG